MKKIVIAAAVIVVVAAAGGAYVWLHKSTPSPTTTSSNNVPAINNAVVITKTSSSLGQYLAEPNSRALYTYGRDSSGTSNCTGSCILTWPAYQDKGSTANLPAGFSTIKRSDHGQTQYTYNGMPLYTFVGVLGSHITGNGISDFSIAKPAASTTSTSGSSSTTTSNSSSSW